MPGLNSKRFRDRANKTVKEENRHSIWESFDFYDLKGRRGSRYLYAPRTTEQGDRNRSYHLQPLANANAGLFLELSTWPIEHEMDRAVEPAPGLPPTLDTDRNAAAAKEWAETYGVLGLGTNPNEERSVGSPESLSLTTARYIGAKNLGHDLSRAYRNSSRGGTHETVGAFAFEAWQAHLARRLYETASRKVLDTASVVRLMDEPPPDDQGLGGPWWLPRSWYWSSERDLNSEDPWSVRRWALGIVEEAVMLKVEHDCYPTLNLVSGDATSDGWPVAYEQGWGTRSLLGAVWLQMLWLMAGDDNKCEWCGAFFEEPRPNKRFCTDKPCRQNAYNQRKKEKPRG